jgi:hypothetical protein
MKLRIRAKESTYVALEASKRDPIRVEAAEDGVSAPTLNAALAHWRTTAWKTCLRYATPIPAP